MKTFKDLQFTSHSIKNAVMAYLEFDNGTYISVVGGGGLYGDGKKTFEIMTTKTEEQNGSVEGWLSKDQITERMLELQKIK